MKEVLTLMIGLLVSAKVNDIVEKSGKESFTKAEITDMLAEACAAAMEDMAKDKK